MNFSITFTLTLCLLTSTVLAVDTSVVHLLFNNDSTNRDNRCSITEWTLIDSILTDSMRVTNESGQRNLRSIIDDSNSINDEVNALDPSPIARQMYPKRCQDDCVGSVNGTCRKPGCEGYTMSQLPAPDEQNGVYPRHCKVDCVGYVNATCRKPGCEGYVFSQSATPPRRRGLYPKRCKDDCAGTTTGKCRKPGCFGYFAAETDPTQPPSPLERRELYHKRCDVDCAGSANGACRKPGCTGYLVSPSAQVSPPLLRRRQLLNQNTMITTLCPKAQIQFIHEKLNDLIRHNKVSTTCQAVLKQKRHVTCYHHENDEKIDE